MSAPVLWICGGVLLLAVLLALFRAEQGPSMLDRVVSLDVVIAALIGAVALWSARTGRADLVSLLTVMAIIGFVAAVTLARFAAAEPEEDDPPLAAGDLENLESAGMLPGDDEEER